MIARLLIVGAALVPLLQALSGCANTPLSTAASMRVEVEVYKGPLSKEPEVQWADLVGLLAEAESALAVVRDGVENNLRADPPPSLADIARLTAMHQDIILAQHLTITPWANACAWTASVYPSIAVGSCTRPTDRAPESARGKQAEKTVDPSSQSPKPASTKDEGKQPAGASKPSDKDLAIQKATTAADSTRTATTDYEASRQGAIDASKASVEGLKQGSKPQVDRDLLRNTLAEIAKVAQQFKLKASLWSEANVPYASPSPSIRRIQITLTALLGTYADRMESKADTLLKQVQGDDRRELALSVSLRETNPPAYLRQFVWYDAGGDNVMQGLQATSRQDDTRDRVRGVERLYADENWSNVNTVYASGQGTVRMALIKDDIGNWNLKSFDSDPSKLLDAYKNVGLAGVKIATDLAKKTSSVGAATEALEMANKFALGAASSPAPTVGVKNIDQLHSDTAKRLTALQATMRSRAAALATQIKTLTDATQQGSKNQTAAEAYDRAKTDVEAATNDLAQASADEKAYSSVRDSLKNKITSQPDLADKLKPEQDDTETKLQDAQNRKRDADTRATTARKAISTNEAGKKQSESDKKMLDAVQRDRDQLPTQAIDQAKLILDGYQSVIDALESGLVSDNSPTSPSSSLNSKLPPAPK